jgi:hypothetical protein
MKATPSFIVITLLVCMTQIIHAQLPTLVSTPKLSLQNNSVQVLYEILNSSVTEKFTIRIEITTANGELIPAHSLSGDIGSGVEGGPEKEIIWDFEADSVYLNEKIFVQIYASPELPATPKQQSPPEEQLEDVNTYQAPADVGTQVSNEDFNRSAIILQSLAFPGLGLSRMNPGKPHWIRGALGYGCIVGSIVLNQQAIKNYDSYQDPENLDKIDDLFNKASQQDQISEVLGYAAVGIWVLDIIWTIVGTSDLNKDQLSLNQYGLSIGTTIEPLSFVPMIALKYRF